MIKTYEDWENSLDQNYVRQLSPDAWDLTGSAFEAGQESQQAKIDELKMSNHHLSVQLVDSNAHYDHVKKERDELQARIDEALRFYNEAKSPHNIGTIQMAIYLKGNKDENY